MMQRILNILGWVGVALVLAALAIRILRPEWNQYVPYVAVAGLVLVLLYPVFNWREIAASFANRRRQSKYAAVAAVSVVVMLGVLIAVNYLSNRRYKRWDLTANQVNTLSEQTLKVLDGLDMPLKLVVIDAATELDRHRPRMSMYDAASTRVSVEYFDYTKDPVRAEGYGITTVPTVAIEYADRRELVTAIDEREITSGIIRAITGDARKMYFLTGHGEADPEGGGPDGYRFVTTLLKGDNVTVETLALAQHQDVPDDATIVAIVGPSADLLEDEVEKLRRYLARGGKMFVLIDPVIEENAQPLTRLTSLLGEWGLEIGNDVVLDVSGRSPQNAALIPVLSYPSHPITDDAPVGTLYVLARSVSPAAKAPEGKTVQPLVQTVEQSWAETDLAGLRAQRQPELNAENGDKPGPVTIAATVTAPVEKKDEGADGKEDDSDDDAPLPQTRIAVFGDSDFASNNFANQLGNAELFLNTVSWLTAQENLISIRPREPSDSRFSITPTALDTLWWFAIVVVPMAVVAAGIGTWVRRRRS